MKGLQGINVTFAMFATYDSGKGLFVEGLFVFEILRSNEESREKEDICLVDRMR